MSGDERLSMKTQFDALAGLQLCDTSVFFTLNELLANGAIGEGGEIIKPEVVLRRGSACIKYLYNEAVRHVESVGLPDGNIKEAKLEDKEKLLGVLSILFV